MLIGGGAIACCAVAAAIAVAMSVSTPSMSEEQSVQGREVSEEDLTPDERDREDRIEGLLSNYVFYKGTVTIYEKQSWKSLYQDASSGIGDAIFSSEEIIVYDNNTDISYIMGRFMSYESQHVVTVNDMNGNYIGTGNVSGLGNLTEYYGKGFLKEVVIEDASASANKQYILDFSMNPVRMNNKESIIYPNPLPHKVDWVTYLSTSDTTRLGAARIWPPDENTNTVLNLVPGLSDISDSKGYNASETYAYEATDRIFVPVGTFTYDYKKMTYEEVREELSELKEDAEFEEAYEEMAKNQPPAWQETALFADDLGAIATSSSMVLNGFEGALSGDFTDSQQIDNSVNSITNNPTIQEGLEKFERDVNDVAADQGSTRQLDDFVLETSNDENGGTEQRRLQAELNAVLPLFKELTDVYDSGQKALQEDLTELKAYSNMTGDRPEDKILTILLDCQENVKILQNANIYLNQMLADFQITLTELNGNPEADTEMRYSELNKVYQLWTETLKTFKNSGNLNFNVDVLSGVTAPKGYPNDVIKIIDGATIAMSEVIKDEETLKDGYALTLKTDLAIEEALQFYKNFLKNVPDVSTFNFNGVSTLTGEKGGYEFSIMVMQNSLGGNEKTALQIMLTPVSE